MTISCGDGNDDKYGGKLNGNEVAARQKRQAMMGGQEKVYNDMNKNTLMGFVYISVGWVGAGRVCRERHRITRGVGVAY